MSGEDAGDGDSPDRPTIRALDERTIRQIAAGEVVERPASVVKELVENSLDADAGRISVAIDAGGTEGIRVRDDGVGMDREAVQRAIEEHTTSKIEDIADLEAGVGTLGFRGEALHTIGAVSRLTIRTKPRAPGDDPAGTELRIEGGEVTAVDPAGCPEGTVVEVDDLFFNTPARKKFLRTTATEFDHVNTVVTHYALANPDVAISLEHDNREVFATEGRGSLRSAVLSVYGREVAESMIDVEYDLVESAVEDADDGTGGPGDDADADGDDTPIDRVRGLVSHPETNRSTREYLSTFVNGRYVTAGVLREAVLDAYGGQLAGDRYPFAVLFVDVPADAVDVNVHPRKMEVRFDDESGVREAVTEAVRTALLEEGLIRSTAPRGRSAADQTEISPESPDTEARGGPGYSPQPESGSPSDASRTRSTRSGSSAEREPNDSAGFTTNTADSDPQTPEGSTAADDHRANSPESDREADPDERVQTAIDAGVDDGETPASGSDTGAADGWSDRAPTDADSNDDRARTIDPVDEDAWSVSGSERAEGAPRANRAGGQEADATSGLSPGYESSTRERGDVDATGDDGEHGDQDGTEPAPESTAASPSRPTGIVGPTVQRDLGGDTATVEPAFDSLPSMRILGQLHDTYVVAETDVGMVLVDQHAADERIHYERLQRELAGDVTTQALAEPVELELTAREAALFEEYVDALSTLGFRAERVGDRRVAVESVPAIFAATLDPELVRDILSAFVSEADGADGGEATVAAVADDLLADLACYPAVTGNTSLTEGSVVNLLETLDACENPYACPHGRPVVIEIDGEEIGDRFERDYPGH